MSCTFKTSIEYVLLNSKGAEYIKSIKTVIRSLDKIFKQRITNT